MADGKTGGGVGIIEEDIPGPLIGFYAPLVVVVADDENGGMTGVILFAVLGRVGLAVLVDIVQGVSVCVLACVPEGTFEPSVFYREAPG